MGFWDALLDIGIGVLNELGKSKASDIAEWLNDMKDSGAAAAVLKRKDGKGIAYITATAYDEDDNIIDSASWNIECNTGFKKFLDGDRSGLSNIFEGKKEIVYTFTNAKYIISKDYKQTGPFNLEQLAMMLQNGLIDASYFACKEGDSNWSPILDVLATAGEEDGEDEEEDEDEDLDDEDFDEDDEDEDDEDDFDDDEDEDEDDFDDEDEDEDDDDFDDEDEDDWDDD